MKNNFLIFYNIIFINIFFRNIFNKIHIYYYIKKKFKILLF